MTNAKYGELHQDIMQKFGQVSLLLPWLPPEIINWEGTWLVRVLSHPMAALMAEGVKKCEIMPQATWTSWGVQGIFITAIIQGAGVITDTSKYLPPKYQKYKSNPTNNGKIVAMVVLGPPDTPSKAEDKGFYSAFSPKGAPAHMHRVISYFKLSTPYEPRNTYNVSGGFHLLAEQDVYGILYAMAQEAKRAPDRCIFRRHDGQETAPLNIYGLPPDPVAIDHALVYLAARKERVVPTTKESCYPAREELFVREVNTPSIYRVTRKGGIADACPLRVSAPEFVLNDAALMAEEGNKYYIDIILAAEGVERPQLLSLRMGRGGVAYTNEWPGPHVMRNGKAVYSYERHPPPHPAYKQFFTEEFSSEVKRVPAPQSQPQPAAPVGMPGFVSRCDFLGLSDDDSHMKSIDILRTRKAGLSAARKWVESATNSVLIYALRYLLTVNAAVRSLKPNHWLFYQASDDTLHLPLMCVSHFNRLRQLDPHKDKAIEFCVVPQTAFEQAAGKLDESCKCRQLAEHEEFKQLHPLCFTGRFCAQNVEAMALRVTPEVSGRLEPYSFKCTGFVPSQAIEEKGGARSPPPVSSTSSSSSNSTRNNSPSSSDVQNAAAALTEINSSADFLAWREKAMTQIKKAREEAATEYQRKIAKLDLAAEQLLAASIEYAQGKHGPRPSLEL